MGAKHSKNSDYIPKAVRHKIKKFERIENEKDVCIFLDSLHQPNKTRTLRNWFKRGFGKLERIEYWINEEEELVLFSISYYNSCINHSFTQDFYVNYNQI
jgi:hypothetical protein